MAPHKISSLFDFIADTPTPYHISSSIQKYFRDRNQKITFLKRALPKNLKDKEICLLTNYGAVVFFRYKKITEKTRFHIWGAHSDSPTLKIRSNSNLKKNNLTFLKTEVYGGPILSTWLDRTFSLAGKIYYKKAKILEKIVHWKTPLLTIPNAAIHINRDINKGFKINKEKHLPALFSGTEKKLEEFLARELDVSEEDILAYDLQLDPLENSHVIGTQGEMMHSPRLDNLLMCLAGLEGFGSSLSSPEDDDVIPMVVLFNHEEIGSASSEGAFSFFLKSVINGMLFGLDEAAKNDLFSRSFFISADAAHAYHPQYSELYEEENNILLGKGIVIKHSSNRHYVSDSQSVACLKNLLIQKKIPFQESNSHGEIPCGSTIGPIVNTQLGINTLDIGTSLLAMHSLKELANVSDYLEMIKLAKEFFTAKLDLP